MEKIDENIVQMYGGFFCYKECYDEMIKWIFKVGKETTKPFDKLSTIENLNKFHKKIIPNSI